jgi:hypothetical protein
LKPKKPNQIEPEPKKTEPNRKYQAKLEKPSQNLFEPVFVLKNQTEPKPVGLIRFRFFFK